VEGRRWAVSEVLFEAKRVLGPVPWLANVRVRGCAPSVSTVLLGVTRIHLPHTRCRFEELFQKGCGLQEESIKFLLFVKDKLPFGTDPQKDEWISTQAARAMETFTPENRRLIPGVMGIIHWKGLDFASSVYVTPVPSFRNSCFADAPCQCSATFLCIRP